MSPAGDFGDMVVDSQGNVTVAFQQGGGVTFNEDINIRNQGDVYLNLAPAPLNLPGVNKSGPWPNSTISLALAPDGRLVAATFHENAAISYENAIFRMLPDSSPVPAGLIEGTATFPAMSQNPDPIPAAQVYLDLNNNGRLDWGEPSAFTDYNGYYEFANLAPGTYHIRAIAPAGMAPADPTSPSSTEGYTVTLGNGAGSRGNDFAFALSQNGILTGTLWIQRDAQGHTAPGGLALSNVAVYVDLNNNGVHDANEPETTTDLAGNYALPVSTTGNYVVRVDDQAASPAGAYQAAQPNGVQVTASVSRVIQDAPAIEGSAPTLLVDVPVLPSYIQGSVYFDENNDGVMDAGDTPLYDPTVYLDLNGNGKVDSTDQASSDIDPAAGTWVIEVPKPGTYNVLLGPIYAHLQQTAPANGRGYTVTITAAQGQAQTGLNFLVGSGGVTNPPPPTPPTSGSPTPTPPTDGSPTPTPPTTGSPAPTPPPVTPTPIPVTRLSPAQQVLEDQSALKADILSRAEQLRAQKTIIHQDSRVLRADIRNVRVLRHELRAGLANGSALSAAQANVATARQQLSADRASLKTLASSTQTAIITARHTFQVDRKVARRDSKKKG